MHDWEAIVREKLSPLPLSNQHAEDVIEEIAQQLEAAYNEARGQGATEEQAVAEAYRQMGDWETLRSRVFRSVEGGLLPLWQQRGFCAPGRLVVWIALLIALAFLASPGFRQVVTMLPVPRAELEPSVVSRVVSDADLGRLERAGDKERYARALAFVALHSHDNQRAVNAANKAIALDPQLTWIAASVSHAMEPIPGRDPQPWINRLKAWDPDNAYPYLLEASARIAAERSVASGLDSAQFLSAIRTSPAWRSAMDEASRAPRVDFYWDREFALNRDVLEEEGLNQPRLLLAGVFEGPFPDVVEINAYFRVLLDEAHATAKSSRTRAALEKYWHIVSFGDRVNAASQFPLVYAPYRRDALENMLPLLARVGRVDEADALRTILSGDDRSAERAAREYKERERASEISAEIVFASAVCFEVLALATVVWLLLAAILKWRPNVSRSLNWLASGLCFAPPALAVASFALFLTYFPYARSIGTITSRRELVATYAPLMARFSTFASKPSANTWITQMFWPAVWCVAVVIFGAALLKLQYHRRARHDQG